MVKWVQKGWLSKMKEEGYRVIEIDNRGKGFQKKRKEEEDYKKRKMEGDEEEMIDNMGIEKENVMGY